MHRWTRSTLLRYTISEFFSSLLGYSPGSPHQLISLSMVNPKRKSLFGYELSSGLDIMYGKQYLHADINSHGPTIGLTDKEGFDTEIGSTNLVTPKTGETHHTSAASIVMFGGGKDHKVIWQAPEP